MEECKGGNMSPSSSMDSSTHPALSTTSSACRPSAAARRDLSTDLRLGLSLSTSSPSSLQAAAESIPSTPRNQVLSDWPPIKTFLRSALQKASAGSTRRRRTLFVKVYMEGVPIGRKLDLLLLDGYDSLLVKLCHMFKTPITCKYANITNDQAVF
uniref:Auxin-responsive protein n=1 Tax=Leersia perrieri TaxID=77586 RepID=A0A0D9UZV1_9ORYZ